MFEIFTLPIVLTAAPALLLAWVYVMSFDRPRWLSVLWFFPAAPAAWLMMAFAVFVLLAAGMATKDVSDGVAVSALVLVALLTLLLPVLPFWLVEGYIVRRWWRAGDRTMAFTGGSAMLAVEILNVLHFEGHLGSWAPDWTWRAMALLLCAWLFLVRVPAPHGAGDPLQPPRTAL